MPPDSRESSPARDERTLRTATAGEESGADWLLLTAPDSVCYATGYAVPLETGPSPFQGGPPLALVARDGTTGLVVTNIEQPAARQGYADLVLDYEGFSDRLQPPLAANYVECVRRLIRELRAGGTVGIEEGSLPVLLVKAIENAFVSTVSVTSALTRARATKTAAEIQLLARAAELAAIGQRAALDRTAAGETELDAFARIRAAMENAHGARMPITGDYISGVERTAECEGWPNERVMKQGEPVICDLSPCANGYWGDSCNTLFIGDPPTQFLDLYRVAERAIAQAVESVKPGVSAAKVASEVARVIADAAYSNPLHIGHGIGTSFHEFPKIVPEEQAMLEPGMVLMMEPGAYRPGVGGARLEWMFEVTATGNRVLTDFEFRLS